VREIFISGENEGLPGEEDARVAPTRHYIIFPPSRSIADIGPCGEVSRMYAGAQSR